MQIKLLNNLLTALSWVVTRDQNILSVKLHVAASLQGLHLWASVESKPFWNSRHWTTRKWAWSYPCPAPDRVFELCSHAQSSWNLKHPRTGAGHLCHLLCQLQDERIYQQIWMLGLLWLHLVALPTSRSVLKADVWMRWTHSLPLLLSRSVVQPGNQGFYIWSKS